MLTAVQLKLGVVVAIDPLGVTRVAAPGGVLLVIVSVPLAVLFAASRAVTVMTVVPSGTGTAAIVHAVVPVATPLAPRSVVQLTCVTPTLSLAVPARATVPFVTVWPPVKVSMATVVPVAAGAVIAIVGGVVSGAAGTVKVKPVPQGPGPTAFEARIHHVAAPGANVIPGLTAHVPEPAPHPTAAAG